MSDQAFVLAEITFTLVLFTAFMIWQFLDLRKAKAETRRKKEEAARLANGPATTTGN